MDLLKAVLMIIPATILLTGCSSNNETTELKISNIQEGKVDLYHLNNDTLWVEDGKIIYLNSGSSSCPPIIDKATEKNNNYTLQEKDYKNDSCTDDLKQMGQIIERVDGKPIGENDNITVNHSH